MKQEEKDKILSVSVKAYESKKHGFLLVENKHGVVFSITPHLQGFQVTCPIIPNTKTGSSIGITGDYWDYASLEKVIDWVENMESCPISNKIYYTTQRSSIVFETLDGAVNRHGNILGYEKIK